MEVRMTMEEYKDLEKAKNDVFIKDNQLHRLREELEQMKAVCLVLFYQRRRPSIHIPYTDFENSILTLRNGTDIVLDIESNSVLVKTNLLGEKF